MKEYGYIRVGALVPHLYLGNPQKNAKEILTQVTLAEKKEVAILLTPELSLTGYTCGDMFLQDQLLEETQKALKEILEGTKNLKVVLIIGLPISVNNQLLNCAAVIQKGKILGLIPKTFIPNYQEFYEQRWFSSSQNISNQEIIILNQSVPITTNLLFQDRTMKEIIFGVEICEDLWATTPPSSQHTIHGATMIFNLSSSNEGIGKQDYRKNLVSMQSAKTISAYIYASSGIMESSSDILFGGASMIYECGSLLKENKRFEINSNLITADIDIKKITNDRRKNRSYMQNVKFENYQIIKIDTNNAQTLERTYNKYPFVPNNKEEQNKRCEEILEIQASALARRLIQLNYPKCIIGMSGGLDSTLAFLVIIKALKKCNKPPSNIIGITMPCFGTTNRTYQNACKIVQEYNAELREINIKEACLIHMKDIGLEKEDQSITYENIQARERTQILMDVANKEKGIVIGTGDLSELALGWCTYNGDHMSMYSINASIPKTLVRYLINWKAQQERGKKKEILEDIINTPISPELLPPTKDGNILQETEATIGPYVLHDFFLYHFLRYGATPKKIYLLAQNTFDKCFTKKEIKKRLKVFIKRFFTQQFKRNCVPDGVKIGSISLSPRGDLRIPSDIEATAWLQEVDKL